MLAGLIAFFKALPTLMRIYDQLKEMFGDNMAKVEADLQIQLDLIRKSRDPSLTIEQKRDLRREALKEGTNMFSRIVS